VSDTVSARELGAYLGLSDRSVRELAARGIIERVGRGRYQLADCVLRYCGHLREVAAGRGGEHGVLDLTQERARLASEQADGHALKNATARRELIPAVEVETTWRGVLSRVRAGMLAVPSRVGAQLPHLTQNEVVMIDREIRDALVELAEGDVADD